MPLGAVESGLFYEVSATPGVRAAGSVRTPGGAHPVYSPCPARGVSEVSAVCGNWVMALGRKLLGEPIWMGS